MTTRTRLLLGLGESLAMVGMVGWAIAIMGQPRSGKVLSLVGMVVSARSLQVGEAVPVIAATSAAANLTTIASGLIVFGEPLPDGALAVAARLGAFALVVVAAFLTPAPTPAAEP